MVRNYIRRYSRRDSDGAVEYIGTLTVGYFATYYVLNKLTGQKQGILPPNIFCIQNLLNLFLPILFLFFVPLHLN